MMNRRRLLMGLAALPAVAVLPKPDIYAEMAHHIWPHQQAFLDGMAKYQAGSWARAHLVVYSTGKALRIRLDDVTLDAKPYTEAGL